jgi:hypothetical protein
VVDADRCNRLIKEWFGSLVDAHVPPIARYRGRVSPSNFATWQDPLWRPQCLCFFSRSQRFVAAPQCPRWEPSVQTTAHRSSGSLAPPADRNPAIAPVDQIQEPTRVSLGQRLGFSFADPGIGPPPEKIVRDRLAEMGIRDVECVKTPFDADGQEQPYVDVPIDGGCEEIGADKSNVPGPDPAAGTAKGVRQAQVLQLAVTDDFRRLGPTRRPERIADE